MPEGNFVGPFKPRSEVTTPWLTPEQRRGIHNELMAYWGKDLQLDMLMEEAMELALAVRRLKRGKGTVDDVVGEMVDVKVMIDQMRTLRDCNYWFEECYDWKLSRAEERMDRHRNTTEENRREVGVALAKDTQPIFKKK